MPKWYWHSPPKKVDVGFIFEVVFVSLLIFLMIWACFK